jgi:hypothetical protein
VLSRSKRTAEIIGVFGREAEICEMKMALATSDLRLRNRLGCQVAVRVQAHATAQAKPFPPHLARENQMRAGIGQLDPRDRAAEADRWAPFMGLGGGQKSAFPRFSPAEVVLIVVLAFVPSRSAHGFDYNSRSFLNLKRDIEGCPPRSFPGGKQSVRGTLTRAPVGVPSCLFPRAGASENGREHVQDGTRSRRAVRDPRSNR